MIISSISSSILSMMRMISSSMYRYLFSLLSLTRLRKSYFFSSTVAGANSRSGWLCRRSFSSTFCWCFEFWFRAASPSRPCSDSRYLCRPCWRLPGSPKTAETRSIALASLQWRLCSFLGSIATFCHTTSTFHTQILGMSRVAYSFYRWD